MRWAPRLVFLVCVIALGACDEGGSPRAPAQDGGGDSGSGLCPDPGNPRVHYTSFDANQCGSIVLDCTVDQNGFQNQCGCGCIDKGDPLCPPIDDPAITWFSRDPAGCPRGLPACPPDDTPFNFESCGCGCIAH